MAPGAIQTPINQAVWSDPAALRDLLEKIPLGRMGNAKEVAEMAVLLASQSTAYLTGTSGFEGGGMLDYPDFAHGG